MNWHVAQINVARTLHPLEHPVMSGFTERLDEINKLAERSSGFVWRYQDEGGNATYTRPYQQDDIIVNLTVWQSVDALRDFVYRSVHRELLTAKRQWFHPPENKQLALWWTPAGTHPSMAEAIARLDHLRRHGGDQIAFNFAKLQAPPGHYTHLTKKACQL